MPHAAGCISLPKVDVAALARHDIEGQEAGGSRALELRYSFDTWTGRFYPGPCWGCGVDAWDLTYK